MRSTLLYNWVTRYSVLYFICFFAEGMLLGSLGPTIPIKAKSAGRLEIDYSIVFTFMGYGLVLGSAVVTRIQKLLGSHKTMSLGLLLISLTGFINHLQNGVVWNAIQWMGIAALHNIITVQAQVELMLFRKQGLNSWFQALHFGYGVGASLTPLLLSIFGIRIFILYSLILLTLSILIFRQKEPILMLGVVQEQVQKVQNQEEPEALKKLIKLIGLFLFVYVGHEINFGGWISTYASVEHVTSQENAGISASLFWIFMTAGRFTAIPVAAKYPTYQYLNFLVSFGVFGSLFCLLLLLFGFKFFAVFAGAAMFGFACSATYPLGLSLPISFGYTLSSANTAWMSMVSMIGITFVPLICGYFMKWFGSNMLYIMGFAFCLVLYYLLQKIMELKPADKDTNSLQQELIQTPSTQI